MIIPETHLHSSSIIVLLYELDIICKDRRQFPRESILIQFVLPTSQPLICSSRMPLNFELS